MSEQLPDNRIRFPAPKMDFETLVGVTGQEHDNYPAPGQQPRFDWMRMVIIGLLSQQSSYSQPTQFREGTPWFDLNDAVLKIFRNNAWAGIAEAIKLGDDSEGRPVMLQDVYATIKTLLGYRPTATFGGRCVTDGTTVIPIPESVRAAAGSGSRAIVWVDGLQIDPRHSEFVGGTAPVSIRLTGGEELNHNQRFTVLLIAIDSAYFAVDDVVV